MPHPLRHMETFSPALLSQRFLYLVQAIRVLSKFLVDFSLKHFQTLFYFSSGYAALHFFFLLDLPPTSPPLEAAPRSPAARRIILSPHLQHPYVPFLTPLTHPPLPRRPLAPIIAPLMPLRKMCWHAGFSAVTLAESFCWIP